MKNLNSTKDLKPHIALRVYKKGFGYGLLTVIDVNQYFIAALCPEELFSEITTGDLVETYLWMEKGMSCEFTLAVTGKIVAPSILAFSHTDNIASSAERKCLRARVTMPISFFPIPLNTSEKSFYTEEVVYLEGTIVELSDREAVLEYHGSVPVDFLLKGRLPLNGEEVDFTGHIVTCDVDENKRRYYIEYVGMSERERIKILDFVFMTYRE